MGMTFNTPDEQGWYWCEDDLGNWYMTFVDTGREFVYFCDVNDPCFDPVDRLRIDSNTVKSIKRWLGPIGCPGGDFHENTVIADAPLHDLAASEGKAIVLVHVDYRHCADSHGSSITMCSVQSRENAEKYIAKEVEDMKRDTEAGQQ